MIATHTMPVARSAAEAHAPQWIDLIPAGVFSGRDGRGPYKNDDPERVIAATQAMDMTAGLPIDFDHATDLGAPHGQPAPAAGWIRQLRIVRGMIQGRVEWTAAGAKAVASKAYRYTSPVFEFDPDGNVTQILRAAVTNNPNLFLTAISSVAGGGQRMTQLLTKDEKAICRNTGTPEADFLAAKAKRNGTAAAAHAAAAPVSGDMRGLMDHIGSFSLPAIRGICARRTPVSHGWPARQRRVI